IINVANGATFTANNGTRLSSNNLTLAGAGAVNLNGINNFGGGALALDGVALNLGTAAALGSRPLTLVSGRFAAPPPGGILLPNAVNFNNANVTLGGSNPILLSGAIALNGTVDALNVSNTALTVFHGLVSGAGQLTKLGAGTLVLSNTANSYTGLTNLNA